MPPLKSPRSRSDRPEDFHRAVDPLFRELILLIGDRAELGRMSSAVLQSLQTQIAQKIRGVDAKLPGREDWNLSRYAIVAWIDDTLIQAENPSQDWWRNHPLEYALDPQRGPEAGIEFFVRAEQAAQLSSGLALSVYFVCVILGFRGAYLPAVDGGVGPQIEQLRERGLPTDLTDWVRNMSEALREFRARRSKPRLADLPLDNRQLVGLPRLLRSSLLLAVLLVVSGAAGYAYYVQRWEGPNTGSSTSEGTP